MTEGRRATDAASEEPTVIGRGIHVKGEITGTAPVEVWGSMEGKTTTRGFLWVRKGGEVGGEIAAADVVVDGRVRGTITAEEKIELGPTSDVRGDVSARTLAIADGSYFQGQVRMRDGDASTRQVRFQEKRGHR